MKRFLLLLLSPLFCLGLDLSLEEKIGQLLMVHFNGREANEEAEKLILETKVGGIIYYTWANGLDSPEQVRHLSEGLQSLAKRNQHALPLFIAIDQEGGRVSRLTEGFMKMPSQQALGQTGDPERAREAAYRMGLELKEAGINVNLAPVVDINSHPTFSIMGDRSFGCTAEVVAAFGHKALQGYHEAG
ncbi:MAG: glycoside hydrolase family 3 protein, partial [Parachlamydia sp.]|nr:glycoside hydrolase family 3 protein [Parachlamydia sp.]